MSKPVNPYETLKRECYRWAMDVLRPRTVTMWHYPKALLVDKWSLADLYERVAAADQLGYDVVLSADSEGLKVRYRQRPPDKPWLLGV